MTPVVGTFENALAPGATISDSYGDSFTVSYTANGDGGASGNDVSLTVATVAAPEPSAFVGGLAGLAVVVGCLRFRRRRPVR